MNKIRNYKMPPSQQEREDFFAEWFQKMFHREYLEHNETDCKIRAAYMAGANNEAFFQTHKGFLSL